MSKKQLRKQLANSIQQRPNNLRYDVASQGLDDLVERAHVLNKRKRKKDKKLSGFVTNFTVPPRRIRHVGSERSSAGASNNSNNNGAGPFPPTAGTKITVERTATTDSWLETIEIPILAAVAALGISNAYSLGYWERRCVFLVCAAVAALGKKWTQDQEENRRRETREEAAREDGGSSGSGEVGSVGTLVEDKLAMPLAWCFVAYWGLGGKWWLRSLVACVALCVRYFIEKGHEKQRMLKSVSVHR